MSNPEKNPRYNPKVHKKSEFKLKKDPKNGMLMLFGPSFTKEDIEKAYSKNPDERVATVMRRSVGL